MNSKSKSHIIMSAGGILFLSGLLASGCSDNKEILSEKEMVNLIVDLKLAEAYANSQMGGADIQKHREELAQGVLAAHHVTQEQLDSTLGWYGHNLDKYAKLYEKVDKRMDAKRKKMLKEDGATTTKERGDNLWPFEENGVLSPFGNSDGWVFTLSDPALERGDRVVWSMNLKDASMPLTGVLGVEYDDGTAEAYTTFMTNRRNVEMSLQTDTGKLVRRLYGTLRFKQSETQPLFVDSIAVRKLPYDSLEYHRFRAQKKYGFPIRVTPEDRRRKAVADSLHKDSISKAQQRRRDSLRNLNRNVSPAGENKSSAPNPSGSLKKDIQQPSKPAKAVPAPTSKSTKTVPAKPVKPVTLKPENDAPLPKKPKGTPKK